MSHLLNSVNTLKPSSIGNIDLTMGSIISSPSSTDILGVDGNGNAKKLSAGTKVGDQVLSYITDTGNWSGGSSLPEGYQLRLRGASCIINKDDSLVTRHVSGSASYIIGWTVAAGNYLFILNHAIDTNSGGNCNAQVYNVATSSYVGPKVHFEEGNFSTTLTYYASVGSSTRFELRARDVTGTCSFLNKTSHFSCTIQIFKV